jgi:hypothetical protein
VYKYYNIAKKEKKEFIMFVSSYSTYISPNTSEKSQKTRDISRAEGATKDYKSSVSSVSQQTLVADSTKLPLSYISNYKALSNRQQFDEQLKNTAQTTKDTSTSAKDRFSKISAMGNAQVSYTENSKMFPIISKPKVTLNQAAPLDKKTSKDIPQNAQNTLKTQMLNTYIENDNYYKITAA